MAEDDRSEVASLVRQILQVMLLLCTRVGVKREFTGADRDASKMRGVNQQRRNWLSREMDLTWQWVGGQLARKQNDQEGQVTGSKSAAVLYLGRWRL